MKVLKFGGTSVGSPQNMKKVADIIDTYPGRKLVVLSAMSGTTNGLLQLVADLKAGDIQGAHKGVDAFIEKYYEVNKALFQSEIFRKEADAYIESRFDFIKSYLHEDSIKLITEVEKIVVAQGELLSTYLFSHYLKEKNRSVSLLSSFDFMRIDSAGEPDLSFITKSLGQIIETEAEQDLFVVQGFICLNPDNEIDNLKRGGSDYSASLIGAALEAEEIQIWTDIDGMHNNDPRFVENTFSVEEISFDEAAELAYFGAKILHPQSVIPAREKNIPVLLKNTFSPLSKGTIIKNCEVPAGVRAIAAKDGITAIKIKSFRMLMAYGFLKKIFEVFEKYKTSIDMITTSEVAVSLTIDDQTHLEKITKELEAFGKVNVDTDQTIVCLAGNFSSNENHTKSIIFNALKNIPIRMVSYGGSKYNVSLLVNTSDKIDALKALNSGIFIPNELIN